MRRGAPSPRRPPTPDGVGFGRVCKRPKRPDCKSDGICLREFESRLSHEPAAAGVNLRSSEAEQPTLTRWVGVSESPGGTSAWCAVRDGSRGVQWRPQRAKPLSAGERRNAAHKSGPVGESGRPRHPVTVEIRGFKSRQGREQLNAAMRASSSGLGPQTSNLMTRVQIPPLARASRASAGRISTPDEPVGVKRGHNVRVA